MPDSLKRLKLKKLPLNRAIISDILLWIALALAAAGAIYYFGIVLPAQRGQIITLHFHNANEISKGSPVRMMGTDIGFVNDLRIQNDYVAVTIQTYPGTLPIPSGSTFNILFTGLAGAKSVEVEVPDTPEPNVNGQPVYLVEEPVRMRDALNASIDVTQALQKGAENITDFFGKKKPVEELQFNIHQAHQMSEAAKQHTIALDQALVQIRHDVHEDSTDTVETISQLQPGLQQAISLTNPTTAKPELQRFFANLQRLSKALQNPRYGALNPVVLNKRLAQFNQLDSQINQHAQSLSQKAQLVPGQLQRLENQSTKISTGINKAAIVTSRDYSPQLLKTRHQIQAVNRSLQQFNQKLSHKAALTNPNKP